MRDARLGARTDAPMLGHPGEEALAGVARRQAGPAIRRHVASCRKCREAVELYRELGAAAPSPGAARECPPALALVQLAAAPASERLGSPWQPHLAACLDCALELEGLERIERGGATLPVLARPRHRSPSLAERLSALLRIEMPLALALEPRRIGPPAVTPAWRRAMHAYAAGDYRQAITDIRRAERAGERSPALAVYLGASLLQTGAAAEAVAALRGVAPRSPRAADARWLLAQALLACGRGKPALIELEALARGRSRHRSAARALAAKVSAALAAAGGGRR